VKPTHRFAAVDALRGLIMMIMAIDHSSAYVSRQHGTSFWNSAISIYDSSFAFFTRLITHLCAPGFFFLMGAGIYWFATSRKEAGWTQAQIIRRTAWRGFAIFLVGQLFETPIIYTQGLLKSAPVQLSHVPMPIPNDAQSLWLGFITLSGLGAAMVICALLLLLRPAAWLGVTVAAVTATHNLLPASGKVGPAWFTILLAPGLSQHVLVVYPVIPWLAVATFGMYCGYLWRQRPTWRNHIWILGFGLILVALSLRFAGGWGNIVPARDSSWIEFLNNVKYPPSLVFWTLSVGTNLLLLTLLLRAPAGWTSSRSPLIVFGQSPLFFYIVHFYVLTAIGYSIFPEAAPLHITYVVWVGLLGIMYPLCLRYRNFKMKKPPESIWRLF
jgi:uncharacterized membrane protein